MEFKQVVEKAMKINGALYEKQEEIIGLFKALEAEESKSGINSEKYISLCGLLSDITAEEDKLVADLKAISAVSVLRDPLLDLDNVVFTASAPIKAWIGYRLQHLIAEGEQLNDFFGELLNSKLLNAVNNSPRLKYLLAYTNPLLCRDLVAANFNVGMIYPQALLAEQSEDDLKQVTNYFILVFKTVVSKICDCDFGEDHILYDYLSIIDAELPREEVEKAVNDIISQCINDCHCEKAHNRIMAIYNVIVKRRKSPQIEIQE